MARRRRRWLFDTYSLSVRQRSCGVEVVSGMVKLCVKSQRAFEWQTSCVLLVLRITCFGSRMRVWLRVHTVVRVITYALGLAVVRSVTICHKACQYLVYL